MPPSLAFQQNSSSVPPPTDGAATADDVLHLVTSNQSTVKMLLGTKMTPSHVGGKVGALADMHLRERDMASAANSLVLTLGLGAIFFVFTAAITVSLVVFCKKRNSIYALRPVKQPDDDGDFEEELEGIGSDFASTCTDANEREFDYDDDNYLYDDEERISEEDRMRDEGLYYANNSALQAFMSNSVTRIYRSLSGNHLGLGGDCCLPPGGSGSSSQYVGMEARNNGDDPSSYRDTEISGFKLPNNDDSQLFLSVSNDRAQFSKGRATSPSSTDRGSSGSRNTTVQRRTYSQYQSLPSTDSMPFVDDADYSCRTLDDDSSTVTDNPWARMATADVNRSTYRPGLVDSRLQGQGDSLQICVNDVIVYPEH